MKFKKKSFIFNGSFVYKDNGQYHILPSFTWYAIRRPGAICYNFHDIKRRKPRKPIIKYGKRKN